MAKNRGAGPICQKNLSPAEGEFDQLLLELARYRMPFGKYKGRYLIDLPEPYVVWFARQGYPKGKLGEMLRVVYEVKVNGLEYLFPPLREST